MTDDLIITEENFKEYFHDVRTHQPQKGEIMACYTATAELVDGFEKRQIIDMLKEMNKAHAITQVMRKLLYACELDSLRVPRLIAEDLANGMSKDDIAKKPYKYTVEFFYYVKPENVPTDDPHWTTISILNLDEFVDRRDGVTITSKICYPEAESQKDDNQT